MLRRNADAAGQVIWRQFAHPGEHGQHGTTLSDEECRAIARKIKEYENAFLTQQISFLETIHEYFTLSGLHHDPVEYRRSVQRYLQGRPVDISVFHAGELEAFSRFRKKPRRRSCCREGIIPKIASDHHGWIKRNVFPRL
jgi:hypothetical protein